MTNPCNHSEDLQKQRDELSQLCHDVAEIKETLDSVKDLLEAWKNAKGAVRVIYILGTTVKWLVVVGVSISAIIFFLKNGVWPQAK